VLYGEGRVRTGNRSNLMALIRAVFSGRKEGVKETGRGQNILKVSIRRGRRRGRGEGKESRKK
jgi:hypothetical protein